MYGLSVNEILDLSILMIGHQDKARAIDLQERIAALSAGWFTPCADLLAERVGKLEAAGCLRLSGTTALRPHRRLQTTPDGLERLRALSGKPAPRPCAAAMLWRRLRLALNDAVPPQQRSATILEMAHLEMAQAEAGLPPTPSRARDVAATGT